jgi:DnaK suppressor protein
MKMYEESRKMAQATSRTKSGNLQYFRQRLEEKLNKLRTQMSTPGASSVLHIEKDPYDSADWAEKSHEEWLFLQRNKIDMKLVHEIDEALARLREGTYGTCEECGLPLSKKRLVAIPWARCCVTCQERQQSGSN